MQYYENFLKESIKNAKNITYIERYKKFVNYYIDNPNSSEVYTEKHHILPESIFPEYKNIKENPWNIIKLTGRQHFLAHWFLAKIYGGKQWFSFNMMRRVGNRSYLYECARKEISKVISQTNKGRKHSEATNRANAERTRGTVVVKDSDGNRSRVSQTDEKYLSGELVYFRTGIKQKEETKEKIGANGHRGKMCFRDENGKHCYLFEDEGLKLGLTPGQRPEVGVRRTKYLNNTIWVTLKSDGKNKRILKDNFNEEIHLKGRIGYEGWKHVNRINAERRKFNGRTITEFEETD